MVVVGGVEAVQRVLPRTTVRASGVPEGALQAAEAAVMGRYCSATAVVPEVEQKVQTTGTTCVGLGCARASWRRHFGLRPRLLMMLQLLLMARWTAEAGAVVVRAAPRGQEAQRQRESAAEEVQARRAAAKRGWMTACAILAAAGASCQWVAAGLCRG